MESLENQNLEEQVQNIEKTVEETRKKLDEKTKEKISFFNIFMLVVAGFINAFGVSIFLTSGKLLDSGISGTSMLFSYLIQYNAPNISKYLPISLFLVVLNIPFFVIGIKKIGINMLIYSFIAIFSYSFAALIYQGFFNLYSPLLELNVFKDLSKPEYTIVCALFGGLLSGIGSGVTIKFGGAMDGIDVLSLLIHKKLNLTVGQVCMIYNAIIYILYATLNNFTDSNTNNLITCLYSLVAYYIGLKTVDFINEGLSKSIMAFVISSNAEEIAKAIESELGRGVTFIKAKGYYKKDDTNMIYSVVNRFEVNKLRNVISSIDSKAFVTFTEISQLVGKKLIRGKRSY